MAAAVTVSIVALAIVLLHSEPRREGTNSLVRRSFVAVTVKPGAKLCEPNQSIPSKVQSMRVFPGVPAGKAGGPLRAVLTDSRSAAPVATARSGVLTATAPLFMKLDPAPAPRTHVRVCFFNAGATPVTLAGNRSAVFNRIGGDVPRIDWMSKPKSWLSFSGTVAKRAGLLKAEWIGTWTLWGIFAGFVLLAGLSVRLVLREADA